MTTQQEQQQQPQIQGLLGKMELDILNQPRGFIKVLQFVFTICAFATTTSFLTMLQLKVVCGDGLEDRTIDVNIPIEYDFQLNDLHITACSVNSPLVFSQDFSSNSRFFVAIGVLAFMYTILALGIYVMCREIYNSHPLAPVVDFVIHVILAVLLLIGSSAWANSLRKLKYATSIESIEQENPVTCAGGGCQIGKDASFMKLDISILLGFLNLFLFASNLWFIYKETSFFKDRQARHEQPVYDTGAPN